MKKLPALLFTLAASFLPLQAAHAAEDVLIVYDASGSMWGQIDGVNKIVTAREVLAELVQGWPQDTNLGLVAYGHRNAGDCRDIETLIAPQQVDREQFIATVNAIDPKGKTPIADSLLHAAEVLQYRDNNATVVLISDGLESCHGDPCAVAAELEKTGVDFTAHVVGFDLDEAGNQALACIADNTGGIFVPASNAAELKGALQQVQDKVVQKAAEPEPEPEPAEPEYELDISAPAQVTTGAPFKMEWTDTIATNDYYTIVPAGTEEGKTGSRSLVGDKGEGVLKAPAEPGLYEVRYVLREGMKTLASAPVEVVEAEVGISAPAQVTTGAPFKMEWTSTIATNDYYTIVPAGTEEGKTGNRGLVGDKGQGSLKAPAEPGLYEVRYVLREGMKTLASAPVEVVEAEMGISAPAQVTTGAPFKIEWSSTVATNDYYTIVPAGTEEGKTGNRGLVGDKGQGSLKAPTEPGLYEVRYVLREGMKTLASAPVEVLEAEMGISAPAQVTTGAPFKIEWTDTIATDDYYTIVPAGTEEGKTGPRGLVSNKGEGSLKAPAEPGLYEVRYVLRTGMKTLASAPVEVVEAEVGISAPETVRAGTPIKLQWTTTIATDDYYTIVPAGTEEGKTGPRSLVGDTGQGTLKAPTEPGLYEVRYVLRVDMKTLASAPVEVVDADATLDSGAGLQAPAQAKAGETITVSWSGGSDAKDQRIALALADAADFTWIEAHKIDDNTSQQLTLPDAPGRYEVRYLDVSNTAVLGRAIVEVTP